MGTEVLPPQDLLAARFHHPPASLHRRKKSSGCGNLIGDRKPKHNTARRRKSPRPEKRRRNAAEGRRGTKKASSGATTTVRPKDEGPIFGHVVLLKRGQPLDSLASKKNHVRKSNPRSPNRKPADDAAVSGTDGIKPPSLSDVYAGSGFAASPPSPRYLPRPFFLNKEQHIDGGPLTPDMQRLLRID